MSSRSISIALSLGLFSILSFGYFSYTTNTRARRSHDEILALRGLASEKDTTIRDLRNSLGDATAELRTLRVATGGMQRDVEAVRRELEACRDELRDVRNTSEGVERRAREEVARVRDLQERTAATLRARTEELGAAQAHLTPSDRASDAEVVGLVEALNGEIFQTAATIAEAFKFGAKDMEAGVEGGSTDAYGDVVDILGPRMTDLLRASRHHRHDQLLIQIALQAAMCAYTEWIITSWYFEGRDEEQLLSNLYSHIQVSEDQAVAGRWRALTRKYAVEAFTEGSDIHQQLVDVVMETMVNILISVGLEAATSQVSETMAAQFAGHTSEVIRRAVALNSAIGQGIISCEISPLYWLPETTFSGETMEDAFGQGPRDGELVLCTTDLGLMRAERHGEEWRRSILRRPKVALQSGLEETIIAEDA